MTDADSSVVTRGSSTWSYIGVGCFTAPIGFFGGGMIAVLVAKIVGAVQGCAPPKDLPACNTFEFLVSGALLGLIALPTAALWRLRQGRRSQIGTTIS